MLASSSKCAQSRLPTGSFFESRTGLVRGMMSQAASWHCYLAARRSPPLVKSPFPGSSGRGSCIFSGPPRLQLAPFPCFFFYLHHFLRVAAPALPVMSH